jgi:hypothetical protein
VRGLPEYITFTSPDPVTYPVPSPEYLAIHAVCAKVAHFLGATRCLDQLDEDAKDRTTLDPNGGSVDILLHVISGLQISAYSVTKSLNARR